ncbi:hypothetical protein L1887_03250 [Cichorium endivia]|nr:hypothetical protein L1887_03250 [Cichorium endivia]
MVVGESWLDFLQPAKVFSQIFGLKVETLDPSATKVFYRNHNADISRTELSGRSAVFNNIVFGLLISNAKENDLTRTGSEDQSQGAARYRLLQSLHKFPKPRFEVFFKEYDSDEEDGEEDDGNTEVVIFAVIYSSGVEKERDLTT